MEILTEIAINDMMWHKHQQITVELFSDIVLKILQFHPRLASVDKLELSVLLTNDEEIAELNHEFRSKNTPTNVLSFPEYDYPLHKLVDITEIKDYIYLGDVAFALETISAEAEEQNKNFIDHFIHLTVHSILHLIGYDHINEQEAQDMENLEVRILELLNIKSPY